MVVAQKTTVTAMTTRSKVSRLSAALPNASREWYDARALFGVVMEQLEVVMQEEQRVKTLVKAYNEDFPTDNPRGVYIHSLHKREI
jgi:hypothetical protein